MQFQQQQRKLTQFATLLFGRTQCATSQYILENGGRFCAVGVRYGGVAVMQYCSLMLVLYGFHRCLKSIRHKVTQGMECVK